MAPPQGGGGGAKKSNHDDEGSKGSLGGGGGKGGGGGGQGGMGNKGGGASSVLSGTPGEASKDTVDFGFERSEALTGRRKKAEQGKKSKGGGFESMDILPEVFRAIKRKGYRIPTPIQRKAIPVALSGADVVAMARTGSGKTAAFLIPVLHKLRVHSLKAGSRAIVLSPTRELALQTFKFAQELSKFTDLRSICIVGGDSMEAQFDDLATNPDLMVATPGRLLHHVEEIDGMTIRSVSHIVLDEADRLLEMGFSDQLRDILKQCADVRQTLLFSATMPSQLAEFVRVGLRDPQVIRLDAEMKVSPDLKLSFTMLRADEKIPALLYILREVVPDKQQTVVFTATRHHVELLVTVLEAEGMTTAAVYGSMDFSARKLNIGRFRARKASVLVVTDVAARGIDIPLLDNVVNFDFPPRPKLFVHRVGRVARAGRTGVAHSILVKEEMGFLVDLHLFLGRPLVAASMTPPSSREEARAWADEADEAQRSVVGMPPPTSLDMVHDRVNELFDARTELDGLRRACDNAYKLYQRTRGGAGNESVARGAELAAAVGPNPTLCASLREEGQLAAAGLAEITQAIRAYRPAATVFEAEIANAAKGGGLKAMAARNCSAMQAKRAAHDKHIVRAQETGHGIVARRRKRNRPELKNGSGDDDDGEGESDDDESEGGSDDDGEDDEFGGGGGGNNSGDDDAMDEEGRYESGEEDEEDEAAGGRPGRAGSARSGGVEGRIKGNKHRQASGAGGEVAATAASVDAFNTGKYRDNDFFLDVTPRGVNHTELGLSTMEDNMGRPMQDHLSLEGALKQATMDIVEEDGKGMTRQRRVSIWDKKKRNYVQVNASEVDKLRGNKRIKTESGAFAKKDEKAVGEMYKKWQARTHKSINATGSQEDPMLSGGKGQGAGRFKYRHSKGGDDDPGGRGGGGRGGRGGGGGGAGGGGWGGEDGGSELKSRDQVRKERVETKKKGRGGGGGGDRESGSFGGRGGGRGGGRDGGRGRGGGSSFGGGGRGGSGGGRGGGGGGRGGRGGGSGGRGGAGGGRGGAGGGRGGSGGRGGGGRGGRR